MNRFSIITLLAAAAIPVRAGNVDQGDYAINYWTDYAIYPLRCVNYNGQDQIMYSMYAKSYNHCSDSPVGTYVTSVDNFVNGYLDQMAANAQDEGSDYQYPSMADYLNCTSGEVNGRGYYLQVGCDASNPTGLSINAYSDDSCTSRASVDTSLLSNDLSLNYKKCMPCVIWMDKNDDEIDDQYYENKQKNAPLCNAAWNYKQACDGKCQAMAREQKVREGWNKADKVLLTVLSVFGEWRLKCCCCGLTHLSLISHLCNTYMPKKALECSWQSSKGAKKCPTKMPSSNKRPSPPPASSRPTS